MRELRAVQSVVRVGVAATVNCLSFNCLSFAVFLHTLQAMSRLRLRHPKAL